MTGNVGVLQCIFVLVPDTLSAKNNNGSTPAHLAAGCGHVDVLQCIYELVPDALSAQDNYGHMPAHIGVMRGHMNVLQFLRKLVPHTLSARDSVGQTPAHHAAFSGHVDALRCLRQLVPDALNAKDITDSTPADLARRHGHTFAAEYLEACEVWSPLLFAAADRLPGVAEELLHNGADPTASQEYQGSNLTALLVAQNLPQAFSWSLEVCPETVKLLKLRAMRWSTQSYRLYPPRFRRGVRHVFGLKVHLERSQELQMLPAVMWQMIVAELPCDWGLDSGK